MSNASVSSMACTSEDQKWNVAAKVKLDEIRGMQSVTEAFSDSCRVCSNFPRTRIRQTVVQPFSSVWPKLGSFLLRQLFPIEFYSCT